MDEAQGTAIEPPIRWILAMDWLAGHSILLCARLCAGFTLTYCVPSQCLPIPDLLRMGSGGAKGAYAPMHCATGSECLPHVSIGGGGGGQTYSLISEANQEG